MISNVLTKIWLNKIPNLDKNLLDQISKEKRVQKLKKQIRRMNQEQLFYLYKLFDKKINQQYAFSTIDICNIIDLKLQLIDSNNIEKIDVEKLYYCLQNNELCSELINQYIDLHNKDCIEQEECLLDIIDAIIRNNHLTASFFKAISMDSNTIFSHYKNIVSSMIYLGSEKFLQLAKSNYDACKKVSLLKYMTNSSDNQYIKNISSSDFIKMIDCVLGNGKYYQERLFLLRYSVENGVNGFYMNQDIVKNISELPDFLLEGVIIARNSNNYEAFIKSISKKCDYFVIKEARETSVIHRECIKDIFYSENFYQLEYMKRLLILKELRLNGKEEETDLERYQKKMNFLLYIKIGEREGFVSYLNDFFALNGVLSFLSGDYSKEELKKRMDYLISVRKGLEEQIVFPPFLNGLYNQKKLRIIDKGETSIAKKLKK